MFTPFWITLTCSMSGIVAEGGASVSFVNRSTAVLLIRGTSELTSLHQWALLRPMKSCYGGKRRTHKSSWNAVS